MSVAYQQCAIDIGPGNARWTGVTMTT